MKVLVTGAAGLLGSAVVTALRDGHDVHAATHADLDISNASAVADAMARVHPDAIVNCAAFPDVDRSEDDPRTALTVNAIAVRILADAARPAGATLIHYSTDFVFDGETSRPYTEADAPNPRNVYAASKLIGEWFAADAPRHYVLRVAGLFGGPGLATTSRRGSLDTIVDGIRAGRVVPVFTDRTVSPSFTPDVASATRAILEQAPPFGTYHCVNAGSSTWREVAEEAARLLGRPLTIRELTLETMTARAVRPRFSALSPAKLAAAGIRMDDWTDALRRYLTGGADA